MQPSDLLKASDGTGNAVLAHVTLNRLTGATVLKVDSVSKYPSPYFIATVGTLGSDGYLTPASTKEFVGHVLAGDIIIDSWEPGFTDTGNTAGQVVVIKQTTGWANRVQATAALMQTFVTQNGDWRSVTSTLTPQTHAGAGFYSLRATGADLTSLLGKNMKMRFDRPTPTITQCLKINATSSVTFPHNAAFNITNQQTVMFWVKADLLAGDVSDGINYQVDKDSGAAGWGIQASRTQTAGFFRTPDTVNVGNGLTYKDWTHVAMVITASSRTVTFYINGRPMFTTQTSVGATAISTSAQVLRLLSGLGNWYFSDYQLYSAALTQAQVIACMQNETTTQTGLVARYKLNGDYTDSSTTGNGAGSVATGTASFVTTDSPYGGRTKEYFRIYSIAFTGGNTDLVLWGDNKSVLPAVITNPMYSTADNPIGWNNIEFDEVMRMENNATYSTGTGGVQQVGIWQTGRAKQWVGDATRSSYTVRFGGNYTIMAKLSTPGINGRAFLSMLFTYPGTAVRQSAVRGLDTSATGGYLASMAVYHGYLPAGTLIDFDIYNGSAGNINIENIALNLMKTDTLNIP